MSESHQDKLREILERMPVSDAPAPWSVIGGSAVGGLTAVGFVPGADTRTNDSHGSTKVAFTLLREVSRVRVDDCAMSSSRRQNRRSIRSFEKSSNPRSWRPEASPKRGAAHRPRCSNCLRAKDSHRAAEARRFHTLQWSPQQLPISFVRTETSVSLLQSQHP